MSSARLRYEIKRLLVCPFNTAIRLGECATLNLNNVRVSAKGLVIIRSGKGDAYREVPLNAEVREALRFWLKERVKRFPQTAELAVFLNRAEKQLSARAIAPAIRRIGTGVLTRVFMG